MPILRATSFILICIATLLGVLIYYMNWNITEILKLFLIGSLFVISSIWFYKKIYTEDD